VIWCLCTNGMYISRDMTRMPVGLFGPVYIDVSRSESPDGSNRNKKYARLATDILILFLLHLRLSSIYLFLSFICSSSLPP
jgi:hypothetical protein